MFINILFVLLSFIAVNMLVAIQILIWAHCDNGSRLLHTFPMLPSWWKSIPSIRVNVRQTRHHLIQFWARKDLNKLESAKTRYLKWFLTIIRANIKVTDLLLSLFVDAFEMKKRSTSLIHIHLFNRVRIFNTNSVFIQHLNITIEKQQDLLNPDKRKSILKFYKLWLW